MNQWPGPISETLPLELRRLVVAACDRFVGAWRVGGRQAIEPFLEGLTSTERTAVLHELVALEVELRSEEGDRPTLREYVERFPDDASVVEAAFASTRETPALDSTAAYISSGPRVEGTEQYATESGVVDGTTAEIRERDDSHESQPRRLGRYQVLRLLGKGSFGNVYLARDGELDRDVAIKVPKARALSMPSRLETLLAEARVAAGLRHPGIVGVYDVGRDEDGSAFIVLEYVEGTTLSNLLRQGRIEPVRLAGLVASVAEAVHHAHRAGLVHRDLKPSNIMIDGQGKPRVADFGLAISEALQLDRAGEVAGTPTYMAPEQVRGEVHRLDGRTDVWALGVILYQGLTGRLAFAARDRAVLFDEILHRDPKPPRQIIDALPRELERICLKCLTKRMVERYQTAADLAEDLHAWLTSIGPVPAGDPVLDAAPKVVPKGLRAFDSDDSDFFLALLPGPRGRDGLPESIRSWKAWIEPHGGERPPGVGLLYGPSGCGKSSLVRAGLLPRLSPHVRTVYVEASSHATEAQLQLALRRRFPDLPTEAGDLPALFAALRRGEGLPAGGKALVILDQFEQWLHARPVAPDADLVRALRQCDGDRVQALVLVRDDFWMAVTRFFQALEVRLVEGGNSGAVELFDETHARRVLLQFGRAYGRAPEGSGEPDAEVKAFLGRASAELAGPEGRIIPVQLALLAEMLRDRPWTLATLRELGGFEGIGETFLEETFGGSAPPTHRLHARAAQAVLRELLPGPDSELKGGLRNIDSLRDAAGYSDRPRDFDELMHILDTELRLVTPVDPEAARAGADGEAIGEVGYQLTHDYLVPSLRLWLTRKQRETRRGRAELRLASIAASWRDRPEPRRLPSAAEWLTILAHCRPRRWSSDERRMMRAATRHFLTRAVLALGLVSAAAFAVHELRDRERSEALLSRAVKADLHQVPELLPEVAARWDRLRTALERVENNPAISDRNRNTVRLLLYHDRPTDQRAAALRASLRGADPGEVAIIRDALAAHPAQAGADRLLGDLLDESTDPAVRLRIACVLAKLLPSGVVDRGELGDPLAQALLAEDRRSLPVWLELLGPSLPLLVDPLLQVCRDPSSEPTRLSAAAETLGEVSIHRGDSLGLGRAVVVTRPEASILLTRYLSRLERLEPALKFMSNVLEVEPSDEAQKDLDAGWKANAVVALAAVGSPEALWPRLRHRPDPRLRSLLIQRLAISELERSLLIKRLALPDIDPVERQALLMTFAETSLTRVPPRAQAEVADIAVKLFREDPHAAAHSAAELLLRRWGRPVEPPAERGPWTGARTVRPGAPGWSTGPNGHVLAILHAPLEFRMGSPEHERGRNDNETLHYRRIDRTLAVGTKEVTIEQFRKYKPDHYHGLPDLEAGCPAYNISWYDAVGYCNWLSHEAGISADQWCYPETILPGMNISAEAVKRHGYRLPTEAEWECLCRGGTETSRPYGESDDLLSHYGWTWLNSGDRTRPTGRLLPNEYGIFDTLGNVWELCHDGPLDASYERPTYPSGTRENPAGESTADETIRNGYTWRLTRGGAFDYTPTMARSAHRDVFRVEKRDIYLGMRVVRTLPPPIDRSQ